MNPQEISSAKNLRLYKRPILLVEDNQTDIKAVERALNEIKVTNPLVAVKDGEEALKYLKDPKSEKPKIILLDINMPRITGLELLKSIREDEELKRIPVIMLTSSIEQQDKMKSFNLSVSGYVLKPLDYQDFVKAIKTINLYWSLSEVPD